MASPLDVQMILCDAAQSDQTTGKIHMLGAGWSITSSPTSHAVAVLIGVPWDRTNQKIPIILRLLDSDGHPVQFDTPAGIQRIEQDSDLEVGRPAGMAPGSVINVGLAVNVPQLPLKPGRFEWHLEAAGEHFGRSFTVTD